MVLEDDSTTFKAILAPLEDLTNSSILKEQHASSDILMYTVNWWCNMSKSNDD